jgi:AcrR family transcriptional regulator
MSPKSVEARREQLLDQLEEIYIADGFRSSRVGQLASRLRCSRSTLYALAPSKEALIVLSVERLIERANVDARCAAATQRSAMAKIATFITAMSNWMVRISPQFWEDVRSFEPTAALFAEKRAIGSQTVTRYLDEGVASGEFRQANTVFLGHVIWLASSAARDPDVLERAGLDSGQAILEVRDLLAQGVQADSLTA